MKNKLRALLLLALVLAASASALGAYRSVRPSRPGLLSGAVYRELTENAAQAQYVLRGQAGYIVVFPNRRGAAAERTTGIALETLRAYDRTMLQRGIPAADQRSLLLLLEDLGS